MNFVLFVTNAILLIGKIPHDTQIVPILSHATSTPASSNDTKYVQNNTYVAISHFDTTNTRAFTPTLKIINQMLRVVEIYVKDYYRH